MPGFRDLGRGVVEREDLPAAERQKLGGDSEVLHGLRCVLPITRRHLEHLEAARELPEDLAQLLQQGPEVLPVPVPPALGEAAPPHPEVAGLQAVGLGGPAAQLPGSEAAEVREALRALDVGDASERAGTQGHRQSGRRRAAARGETVDEQALLLPRAVQQQGHEVAPQLRRQEAEDSLGDVLQVGGPPGDRHLRRVG